jgi:hypothetical protein
MWIDHCGAVEVRNGSVEVFLMDLRIPTIQDGNRVIRVEFDGARAVFDRPVEIAGAYLQSRAAGVGRGGLWIEFDSAIEVGDAPWIVAFSGLGEASIYDGSQGFWIELNTEVIVCNRRVQIPLFNSCSRSTNVK